MLIFAVIISSINIGMKKVSAVNTTTLYGNAVKAVVGNEVKIPVRIKDNQGVAGLGLKVTYDSNVMTPLKVDKGEVLSGLSNLQFGDTISTSTKDGVLECVAFNDSNFSGNGELFILIFQISDSVSAGSYELALGLSEHYDESLEDVPVVCENIAITVTKKDSSISTQAPNPTPVEDVLDDFHVYLGYTNHSWTESFFHQEKPGITISGDGNYTFSYTVQETDTDIHTLLLETDLDYFDVVDRLCIIPTKLVCGGKEYGIQDYSIGYELQENGRYAYRIFLRNPYVGNFEGLGGVTIPVTAGNAILIDFTVAGMGKNAGVQSTNVPVSTPNASSGSSGTAPTAQATVSPSGTTNKSTTKHTLIKKPARVKIKTIKKAKKGIVKVKLNKVKCSHGYQIQYSTTRSFSKKTKRTSNSRSFYLWIKPKTTYYVRVRAVNKGWTSQTKYGYKYGKWSKVKKIRLK